MDSQSGLTQSTTLFSQVQEFGAVPDGSVSRRLKFLDVNHAADNPELLRRLAVRADPFGSIGEFFAVQIRYVHNNRTLAGLTGQWN